MGKGGRPKDEYILLLDMAKELCMMENNDKRREIRKYFIKCEKEYTQPLKNKSLSLGSENLFNRLSGTSYNHIIELFLIFKMLLVKK